MMVFSSDTRLLAADSRRVQLFDVFAGKVVTEIELHDAAVRTLVPSPDGKLLVTGSETGEILIWDIAKFE